MSTAHEREGQRLSHSADLEWFFNDRRGDLGLHAQNYDPDRWRGDSVDPDRHGVARTASVQREQRVLAALRLLNREHDRVICVAYSEHRWRGLERLGRAAGVAAWLYDPEDAIDGGLALATLVNQEGARDYLKEHFARAEATLRAAFVAYGKAAEKVAAQRDAERAMRAERDRKQAARMGVKWTAPTPGEDD
jgi:hypothetical protein